MKSSFSLAASFRLIHPLALYNGLGIVSFKRLLGSSKNVVRKGHFRQRRKEINRHAKRELRYAKLFLKIGMGFGHNHNGSSSTQTLVERKYIYRGIYKKSIIWSTITSDTPLDSYNGCYLWEVIGRPGKTIFPNPAGFIFDFILVHFSSWLSSIICNTR